MVSDLPRELLLLIADFLSPMSRCRLMWTCKRNRAVLYPQALYSYRFHYLHIDHFWKLDKADSLQARYVESVDICLQNHSLNRDDSRSYKEVCNQLQDLKAPALVEHFNEPLAYPAYLARFPNLIALQDTTYVDLSPWDNVDIWQGCLQTRMFENLQYLSIQAYCKWHAFVGLLNLPVLQSLYIDFVKLNDSDAHLSGSLDISSSLKILQIYKSSIAAPYWKAILGKIRNLEMFAYDHSYGGPDAARYDPRAVIEALVQHHKASLTALRLHSDDSLTVDGRHPWLPLYHLPKLKYLACGWQDMMPDELDYVPVDDRPVLAISDVPPASLKEFFFENTHEAMTWDRGVLERSSINLIDLINSPKIQLDAVRVRHPDDLAKAAAKQADIPWEDHLWWSYEAFAMPDEDGEWLTDFNTFERSLIRGSRYDELRASND